MAKILGFLALAMVMVLLAWQVSGGIYAAMAIGFLGLGLINGSRKKT